MKLYISSVIGGPEASGASVDILITRLAKASHAYQLAHPIPSEGGLDIVYHIPGSVIQAEFEGIRTAKFSRKEKLLMVQIAVPNLFENEHHMETYIVESLREAIRLSKPVFKSARIHFAHEKYMQLVDALDRNEYQAHM